LKALWELPELGAERGVFWWFHHQNTPIFHLYLRRFPKTLFEVEKYWKETRIEYCSIAL
jgi:hypothetical protein